MGQLVHIYGGALEAARDARGLHKWVNDKTASGSLQVLTDATMYYDIPAGKQVIIVQAYIGVETVSDDIHVEVVSCSAVAGGGTATALSGHYHLFTGANLVGTEDKEREFMPPLIAKYSDGARSVTMRINANDASCVISCGWMGWVEPET